MDIHLVVKYAVHHSKAVLAPSFFQYWPAWTVVHGSYTAGSIIGSGSLSPLGGGRGVSLVKVPAD